MVRPRLARVRANRSREADLMESVTHPYNKLKEGPETLAPPRVTDENRGARGVSHAGVIERRGVPRLGGQFFASEREAGAATSCGVEVFFSSLNEKQEKLRKARRNPGDLEEAGVLDVPGGRSSVEAASSRRDFRGTCVRCPFP